MDAIRAILPTLELAAFCLSGFVWLRSRANPYPVAVAIALGIVSALGSLSLLFQIGFLLGRPDLLPICEIALLLGSLWLNRKHWHQLADIPRSLLTAWRTLPIALTALAIALCYLFLQAYLLPPSSWDSLTYHLPRVLLWEQNRSLLLDTYTIAPQAAFPVGSDILYHLFLRFRLDYGLGLFSWLSYLVILVGTYGLVRTRVSRTIAATTAIVFACLPEIVYQATGTKNDIVFAAVALASVLWGDRWLRSPSFGALVGLGLTLCFGLSVKISFVLFAFFFGLVWLALVVQKGLTMTLLDNLLRNGSKLLLCLGPAAVLLQLWLFAHNAQQFGSLLSPPDFALNNQNNDGLLGAIANLTRYGFQAIHLLDPLNQLVKSGLGASLTDSLQLLYDNLFEPLWGKAGFSRIAPETFTILWQPQEDTSWFGPISLVLVFPAVGWCLAKSRGMARATAIVAIALTLAISYKLGWSPWKARFFTPVVTCMGLSVALFLQRYQHQPWKLRLWRWISLGILFYSCLYNYSKPVIPSDSYISRQNIWTASDWTRNRAIYDLLYDGGQAQAIGQALAEDQAKQVAIVGYDHYFSLMFNHPEIEFTFLLAKARLDGSYGLAQIAAEVAIADHLVCFTERCNDVGAGVRLKPILGNHSESPGPVVYRVLPLTEGMTEES